MAAPVVFKIIELLGAAAIGVVLERSAPEGKIWDWFKARISNGEELLWKLKTDLTAVSKVLDDAENKEITDPSVKSWLDDLKDVAYDAEDLLAYESHAIASDSSSAVAEDGTEVEEKLKKILGRLHHLTEAMKILGLRDCGREADVYGHNLPLERRTTSLVGDSVVEARAADTEAITELLMSEETDGANGLCVIAIVGMGGLGKTTLAQLVYCRKVVSEKFQLKAWICVSEASDVFLVTKNILKGFAPGLRGIDKMTEDLLQTSLRDALTGKRFLLVLDDVWNESYDEFWKDLLKPLKHGFQGSRIIVTTRSHNVKKYADEFAVHIYPLRNLSEDECWLVFARSAFRGKEQPPDSDLVAIGRKLAAKCKGLPLVATALGRLLCGKKDITEWDWIMTREIWNLEGCPILPVLWLSYRDLPSSHKRCFAYCALFPKDYEFKIHELVRLWMADGIFDSRRGNKPMDESGADCFDTLLSKSFFEKSRVTPGCFVMHDLIHDLAKYVAGYFFSFLEIDKACSMPERTRHFSYQLAQKRTPIEWAVISQGKSLRSWLHISNRLFADFDLMDTAVCHLLETSKCLRVLSLANHNSIKEVPESIGNLKLLRYLDLSRTSIERLPDVVFKLCNLETLLLEDCKKLEEVPDSIGYLKFLLFLNLSGTAINKLPTDLCNLVNLCFLDISNTKLQGMPPELGKLTRLQKLEDFFVGKGSSWSSIEELKVLSKLKGMLRIWNIQNIMNAQGASGSNLKGKKHLKDLKLSWEGDDTDDSEHELRVLEGLEPPCTLEHLTMRGYRSTKFPDWVGRRSFSKLVSLRIEGCKNCYEMPPLGHVDSLTSLYISGCDNIEVVGPSFYGNPLPANDEPTFKSLKVLHFEGMSEWIKWEQHDGAFPRLEELRLSECPKLESALPGELPSLKELEIEGCDQLAAPFPRARAIVKVRVESDVLSGSYLSLSGINTSSPSQLLGDIRRTLGERIVDLKRLSFYECDMASGYQGTKLESLKISNCPELESFPEGGLPSKLESLEIYGCKKLMERRNEWNLQALPSLSSLDETESFPEEGMLLPPTLTTLRIRFLDGLKSLDYKGLQHLTSLKTLEIWNCYSLEKLVTDKEEGEEGLLPESLTTLELRHIPNLKSLSPILRLTSLRSLIISECNKISEDVTLPSTITFLQLIGMKMKSLHGWGLQSLTSLEELRILSCHNIESVTTREEPLPSSLRVIELMSCPRLRSIQRGEAIPSSLTSLHIVGCPLLEEKYQNFYCGAAEGVELTITDEASRLENLPHGISALIVFAPPSRFPSTRFQAEFFVEIEFSGCFRNEQAWMGRQCFGSIRVIGFSKSNLKKLPDLSEARQARRLVLQGCINLVDIASIQYLVKLEHLDLKGCTCLTGLPSIMHLENLISIDLSYCRNLKRLRPSLGCLKRLAYLNLRNCKRLENLPISTFTVKSIQSLDISGCSLLIMRASEA